MNTYIRDVLSFSNNGVKQQKKCLEVLIDLVQALCGPGWYEVYLSLYNQLPAPHTENTLYTIRSLRAGYLIVALHHISST